jgi:hypothetical protein
MVIFSATCIGASHLKMEKHCQDFSANWHCDKTAIIAVADGHGSDDYFRSDRGSRFAVEAALHCIKEMIFIKKDRLQQPEAELEALKKSIITAWYEKIAEDVRGDPLSGNVFSPYGTTLLAAAITEYYWFALQIGDGKCVCFNKDSFVTQPVPWDERCFLNKTTSLCDEDAKSLFRHYYSETLPDAIFLGSDGIDDSFPINKNEEHLSRFYESVYNNFKNEGLKNGEIQLREILPLLTQKGSGDDISIAGIIRG